MMHNGFQAYTEKPSGVRPLPLLVTALASAVIGMALGQDAKPPVQADETKRIDRLIAQLGKGTAAEREKASQELIAIGEPALEALRQVIKSGDKDIAPRARACFSQIQKNQRAIQYIEDLQEREPRIRAKAGRILMEVLLEDKQAAKVALPKLLHVVDDADRQLRHLAIVAIGQIGPTAKPAASKLLEIVRDEKKGTDNRVAAALVLGQIGADGEPTVTTLLGLLKSDEAHLRAAGAWALATVGRHDDRLVPALIQALQDGDVGTQRCAAESLGRIGKQAAAVVPALIRLLEKHQGPQVRNNPRLGVLAALGQFGPEAQVAVPLIRGLLERHKSDIALQLSATEALRAIQPQGEASAGKPVPPRQERIGRLIAQLGSRTFAERESASQGLIALGEPALEAVREALRSPDKEIARRAQACLMMMELNVAFLNRIMALHAPDAQIRARAAYALIWYKRDGMVALRALVEALDDKEPDVRYHAVVAIGQIGSGAKPAVPKLLDIIKDDNYAMDTRIVAVLNLAKIPADSEPVLTLHLAMLQSDQPGLRTVAAGVLGTIGRKDRRVVPALLKALEDPDVCTRGNAAASLGLIGKDPATVVPALTRLLEKCKGPRVENDPRDCVLGALSRFGPAAKDAVPHILDILEGNKGDIGLRQSALKALGSISPGAEKTLLSPAGKAARRRISKNPN